MGSPRDNIWIEPGRRPRLRDVREYAEIPDEGFTNALEWAEAKEYSSRAFWWVIRWLASDDSSWASGWSREVAWTNLYKLAPADGGNPDDALCDAQVHYCRELLRLEVARFRPSAVVFLSGRDWAIDFVGADFFAKGKAEGWVHTGRFRGIPAVVAPHPLRASRLRIKRRTLAQRILRAVEDAGWEPDSW